MEEQNRLIELLMEREKAPPTRKRKRSYDPPSSEDEEEDNRPLSPRSRAREKEEVSDAESSNDDDLEPIVRKDTPILTRYRKRPRRDILEDIGSPWLAAHLKDHRREFEVKGKSPYPIPRARPTEYTVLQKPFNRSLLARFKACKETAKKLEKIYSVLILAEGSFETLWTKAVLATSLQMATMNEEMAAILLEAQGLKDHVQNGSFFTSDSEVQDVKDTQQQNLFASAIRRPSSHSRGGDRGSVKRETPRDPKKFKSRRGK